MNEKDLYTNLVMTRNAIDKGIAGIGTKRSVIIRNHIQAAMEITNEPDYLPDARERVKFAILCSFAAVLAIEAASLSMINRFFVNTSIGLYVLILFVTVLALLIVTLKLESITEMIAKSGNPTLIKIFISQKN